MESKATTTTLFDSVTEYKPEKMVMRNVTPEPHTNHFDGTEYRKSSGTGMFIAPKKRKIYYSCAGKVSVRNV